MGQLTHCEECDKEFRVGDIIPHPHDHSVLPDPIPETVGDALAVWDSGESLFTVEMGGISPGYEQAIQVLAFALMRHGIDNGHPGMGETGDEAQRWGDEVISAHDLKWGYSGAQVGAAKSLALMVLIRGYRAALRMPEVKDRLIQVDGRLHYDPEGR